MVEVQSDDKYIYIKKRYMEDKPYVDTIKLDIGQAELLLGLLDEEIKEFYLRGWEEGRVF